MYGGDQSQKHYVANVIEGKLVVGEDQIYYATGTNKDEKIL